MEERAGAIAMVLSDSSSHQNMVSSSSDEETNSRALVVVLAVEEIHEVCIFSRQDKEDVVGRSCEVGPSSLIKAQREQERNLEL